MSAAPSKARAWLELGRVSKLPTVWSNVVHGLAAAWFTGVGLQMEEAYGFGPDVTGRSLTELLDQGFLLLVGASLLYTGGMVLNDVCDYAADLKERPSRPLPSGRVSRRAALVAGVGLLAAGWACTLVYRPRVAAWAGALTAAIVAYNLLHRFRLLGLALMAACRGLLLWTAASAIQAGTGLDADPVRVLESVLAVACYTLLVTVVAWREALPSLPWLSRCVATLIALMPLVDAAFLWNFGMAPMALFCVGCAVLTLLAQRFVPGS